MRILVVGPEYPDSFARNVVVTLRQMGFEVSSDYPGAHSERSVKGPYPLFSLAVRLWPRLENFVQHRFVRRAEALRPDLVLVTYDGVTPQTVKRLRGISPVVAAWYTDPSPNLERDYLLAGDYHCWFFKEPRAVALFRANLGLPVYFLPECCNPAWHRRVEVSEKDLAKYGCDIALAGNCYYYRLKMIEGLSAFDLRIWGGSIARWLDHPMLKFHAHHYVAELEKAKAFLAAKIVLNTFTHKETDGVNCRLFEATGCGGFVLTENRPTIKDFFTPGKEVAVFNSREELLDQVRYYLAHPEEREKIAGRGYERTHRDHTYEARLRKLLAIVGQHTSLRLLEEGAAAESPATASGVSEASDRVSAQ
jgi:spore maturation protein CgeB